MISLKNISPADKKALYKYIAWQSFKVLIIIFSLLRIIPSSEQELDSVWYKLHLNQEALITLLILLPFMGVMYYIIRNSTFNKYHRYADFSGKQQLRTYLTALAWVAPFSGIIISSYILASCSLMQRLLLFVASLGLAFWQANSGIRAAAGFHDENKTDVQS